MRQKLRMYITFFFACALGVSGEFAHSQSAAPFEMAVRQSLLSLISELRTEIDHQSAGYHNGYDLQTPIDPRLKLIGQPIQVLLSNAIGAQGLQNFNAQVLHEHGVSNWTLGALENGKIVVYSFVISNIGQISPSDSAATTIWGGPNSAFRNASAIWGPQSAQARTFSYDLDHSVLPRPAGPPSLSVPPLAARPMPPVVDPRVVEFLFASTRKQIARPPTENVSYSGERGLLTFGAASVRIPEDHKIGRIELPSSWSLFGYTLRTFAPNEQEHFIIKRVVPLSEQRFGEIIRAKGTKTALVFVHGFNTTFEDALYRNAQIVWDLQYKGLSVLFTWASRGEVMDYVYDRNSALIARDAFITLLQKLKREYGIEEVNVLAHSMGNLVALDALANYARTSNPIHIAHLIMAAPDVDRDQFEALAPVAKAIVGGMTLYASSADRAMTLSRKLAGGIPRAGDVPAGDPVVLKNLETIDVTAVGDEIFGLNHDVFAASRDVMEDISAMLRLDRPPPRLIQIHPMPEPPAARRYWRFVP
jgi:esterase/lipase superfamily enzyme